MNTLIKFGALLFTIGVSALALTVVILSDTGHSGFDLAGGRTELLVDGEPSC